MGKLYMVSVTVEADFTVPVEADSEEEAKVIASDFDLLDLDFETYTVAREVDKCPDWALNEIAEGSGGKTCAEVLAGDDYKEQRQREMEESWPKLPGFSDPVPATI